MSNPAASPSAETPDVPATDNDMRQSLAQDLLSIGRA